MASPAANASHPRLYLHANAGYSHGLTITQMATRLTGNNATAYQAMINRADAQYATADASLGTYETAIMALIGLLGHGSDNAAGMTFAQTNAAYSAKAAAAMVAQDTALTGNAWHRKAWPGIAWAMAYDYLVAGGHLTGAQQDTHITHVAALSLPAQDLTDDQPGDTLMGWAIHHLSVYGDRTGVGEANEAGVVDAEYDANYFDWVTDGIGAFVRMHAYLAGPGYANKDYWHHSTRDGCMSIYLGEAHRGAFTEDSLTTFWDTFTYSFTWWDGESYTYRRGDCVTQWPYWLAHTMVPWGTWDDGWVTSDALHLMLGADPRLGVDTTSEKFAHMVRASRMANAWDTATASLAQWFVDTLPTARFDLTAHREGMWADALLNPGGITGKRPDHADILLPAQKHAKTGDWIMWRNGGWASDAQIGGASGGPAQVNASLIAFCAPKHRTRQPNATNAGGVYYAYHGWLQGMTRSRGHGPREEPFLSSGCVTFHDPTWTEANYSAGADILNGGQFTNPATPTIDFANWAPDGYRAGEADEFWQCRTSRLSHDQDTSAGYNYVMLDLTRSYDSTRFVVNSATSTEWIESLTRSTVHIPAATPGTNAEVVVHLYRLHKGAAGYEPRIHFSFPVAPTLGGTETDNAPTKNFRGYQPTGYEGAYYKRYTGAGIQNISVANAVQGANAELYKTIVYPTSTASYEIERLGEPTPADEWGNTGKLLTVSSITRTGSTATVTTTSQHKLTVGMTASIRRADGTYYSADHTVDTVPTTTTFTIDTGVDTPADPGILSGYDAIICYNRRGSEFDDQHGTPYDTNRSMEGVSVETPARNQLVCPFRIQVVLTDNQTEHQCLIVDEFGPASISKTTVQALTESGGVFCGVQFGSTHVVAFAKAPIRQGVAVDYEEARVESGAFTVPDAGTYTVIITDLPSDRSVTVSGGTSPVVATTDGAGVWTGTVTTGGAATTLTVTAAGAAPSVTATMNTTLTLAGDPDVFTPPTPGGSPTTRRSRLRIGI